MIDLKDIAIDTREVEVTYPGLEHFVVKMRYISRSKSQSILKGAQVTKLVNGRSMQELDQDKFNVDFAREAIIGWKGLTIGDLENLMLIDAGDRDISEEVPYSVDNAMVLMKNSSAFEEFVNTTVFNLDSFRSRK